jgi:hypothetical protein
MDEKKGRWKERNTKMNTEINTQTKVSSNREHNII